MLYKEKYSFDKIITYILSNYVFKHLTYTRFWAFQYWKEEYMV